MSEAAEISSAVSVPKRHAGLADFFIRLVREKPLGTVGAVIVFILFIVGIFAEPAPVDLGRFFLRELRLRGVRLYEPEDFETAIPLVASRAVPFERLISDVRPLEKIQETFQEIERGANFTKVLLKCGD